MSVKKIIIGLLVAIFLTALYSYRLLDVPTGLTVDEASFGYNAVLLSQTGRDERGITNPFFVLYVKGNDWRQPLTQYYLTGLFKIFGPSVYLLRFSSVIIAVISVFGVYFLAKSIMKEVPAIIAATGFALAPLIMIQAHLGLDNIMPVPLVILWLFSLRKYLVKRSLIWICISALAIGASFYSYKGMRAIAPIWIILTSAWLLIDVLTKKTSPKGLVIFLLAVAPFFLIIPGLERQYPRSLLGNANPVIDNVYQFFAPYLSSFDPSYIFIRGDITDFHSTGKHGMLLLASLPLIIAGFYAAARGKESFPKFLLLALFAGPILYGMVGSEHRFSRLMALIPLFALLMGIGYDWLWQNHHRWLKGLALITILLMGVNYADFISYYWNKYPSTTFNLLGEMDYYQDVARFSRLVEKEGADPIIHFSVSDGGGESMKFFQQIYFGKQILTIPDKEAAEPGQLLFTVRKEVEGMEEIDSSQTGYHIQRSK